MATSAARVVRMIFFIEGYSISLLREIEAHYARMMARAG
ncbi:hypothetical protein AGR1A_Cc50179 [Agrobacterium fabacearum CFBP 5771]|nr:hypothetical protein AGR1A_Cc50179 [Agrobacterium fabacearum CFBP 5771]